MSRRHLRSPLLALAGAVALVSAGCGVSLGDEVANVSSGTETTATSTAPEKVDEGTFQGTGGVVSLQKAADATAEVRTQKMSMVMEMDGVPEMGNVRMTYDGAFDNEAQQGTMTIDMSDMLAGSGFGGDEMGRMEMVIDGETIYIKSPLFSMLGGDAKPWVEVPASELSSDSGGLGTGMQSDPGAFLDFLRNAGAEVETVGTEDVRGVSTTHIRTELDLASMMEDASEGERAELEEQLEDLGGAADSFRTIPAEAWIDENGYVRKFELTFDFASAADASPEMAGVTMVVSIELYDFNEPVTVKIPDPAEVGELDPSILSDN